MKLYLIRHAESENNARWKKTGARKGYVSDPLLTEKGHRQAVLLAKHLAKRREINGVPERDPFNRCGYQITHVYTSLMQRAIQTAAYITEALKLPLQGRTELCERGGLVQEEPEQEEPIGIPGPGRSFFAATYPNLKIPESVRESGWWNRPYESPDEAMLRARRVLADLQDRHGNNEDDNVAFVSHGGFINKLLKELIGATKPDYYKGLLYGTWFGASNTSITKIEYEPDLVLLTYHNRIDHLPAELIS